MDKILVIEDSEEYQSLFVEALSSEYEVKVAKSGREGMSLAVDYMPNIILLDITLGDVDGFEVCHYIRNEKEVQSVPIIFISSRNDVHSKIMGFDLGADDFIEKPFSIDELKARIKVRLKGSQRQRETLSTFEHDGIKIDFLGHRVFLDSQEVFFSSLEFKLLSYFVRNADRVLSRHNILNDVWGVQTFVTDRVVDSHIRSIRKKLGQYKDYIESIYGEGYRFNPSPPSSLTSKKTYQSAA